ncbi:MAG: hypothetical protein JST89_17835 [Cyanobacteria bacterium SZAS-4]|nr:hypothetical protein [Cyanobacteria bacterium SZAS-4]
MPRILVLILGVLVGYVAYNFGSRLRTNRELEIDATETNGADDHDASWMPMTIADSIRKAVAEKQAQQASGEAKDD